ncbi:hypothetical protein QVD17_25072 [Tagetes erecta]|uniref:Uncharacterized protein n=1 Tax=Tagetes erecta TaxID=13708 RepID=A0AAD8KIR5_TARER|nr:hypothetical protein QVD17_25072 [Tagetes erecta]
MDRSVTNPLLPSQQLVIQFRLIDVVTRLVLYALTYGNLNFQSPNMDVVREALILHDVNINELEVKHGVLVHGGGGFGAWCWYKTIELLEEC